MATEATPLHAPAANFELAMTRSRMHLVSNPQTGSPYPFWGACARTEDFGVLGAQALAHVHFISSALKMGGAVAILGLLLMVSGNDDSRSNEAGTAAGWRELTWVHVLGDALVMSIFVAFIMRQQFLLAKPDDEGRVQREVKKKLSLFHLDKLPGPSISFDIRAVTNKMEKAMQGKGMAFLPAVRRLPCRVVCVTRCVPIQHAGRCVLCPVCRLCPWRFSGILQGSIQGGGGVC